MNFKEKLVTALVWLMVQVGVPSSDILKFVEDTKGKVSMGAIIGISIALIVAAAILPTAVVDITNTTKWTGAPTAVLTLVPIIGVVAIVAVLLMLVRSRR